MIRQSDLQGMIGVYRGLEAGMRDAAMKEQAE